MKHTVQTVEQAPVNHALLNVVTPMGLSFEKNRLSIGENIGKAYGIIRYPQKVDVEWLSKLTNIPGTLVSIGFKPVDNGTLINAISRSVVQQRGLADGAKDPLSRQRAEKAAEDGEKIIMQIDREGETVGLMSVEVMPVAREEKEFKKACRRAESVASVMKCKMRAIPNLQKEAFMHLSPTFPNHAKMESILQKVVPFSTFVGGFPFASSGFNDGEGYYFAKDRNGGLVIVDTWKRGGNRTNSNFCVMGNSGVGKSTAIKHILLSEYMKGTRIIVIDPESEYRDLCQNLNGDWINAVGGSKGMINPLQVRPSPRDDEDEKEELRLYRDEGYGINELGNGQLSELAMHMKNLEIFFSLYIPSLTDMQKAVLKKCLVELYQKFHITWDTDVAKLKPQDFPIFSDLYALVQEKTKTEKENQVYTDLSMLLYDIAEGADSFIWNGHTTVSGSSRFTVMDTHALQETGDNIKRTQYFNILTYDWEQMSRDREERVLLICDEAYLMIDQKVPQSLVYLRNVMKRARKYEAALGIISHSLVDFLHESIKQYGQALLDIPCYKILMGTDGKNLKETADLYDLTEAEQELLLARKRGHALFMAGAKRLHIQFDIPEYKFNYMGKGGAKMADPILVKLLAEAALQAAKDKESRNRLLAIILGPVIFLLLLVALVMYLATSPFSALSEWLVGDEVAAVNEFQKDYGYNNDSGIFERDFKEADGQEYDEDILLGREGETQVVYYNQLDERWADEPYGQDKIGTHGCGPTSMSIVVSTLTGTNVDPVEMAQWSYENGYYCPGGGSYHSLIPKAAEHWGLSVDINLDGEDVADALAEGKLVVAIMSKGHFTKSGHFIVLRGITADGKVLVADPASLKRSNQEWDLSLILEEARKRVGAGGPFWAISN